LNYSFISSIYIIKTKIQVSLLIKLDIDVAFRSVVDCAAKDSNTPGLSIQLEGRARQGKIKLEFGSVGASKEMATGGDINILRYFV